MIHRPFFCRDKDDDYAPVDYSYVPSVSEGRRRQQAQNIRRSDPQNAVARHRADPFGRDAVDGYGTRAPQAAPLSKAAPSPQVMSRLPSLADGPAPAASIAYPDDYGIPDNPFAPPPEPPRPTAETGAPRQGSRAQEGADMFRQGAYMSEDADMPVAASDTAPTAGFAARQGSRAPEDAAMPAAASDTAPAAGFAARQGSRAPENAAAPAAVSGTAPTAGFAARQGSRAPEEAASPAAASIASPAAAPVPSPRQAARTAVPTPLEAPPAIIAEDGSQFDAPVAPPMPEWLRVAQQNHMPMDDRRARAPRVQAAPRHEDEAAREVPTDLLGRPLRQSAAPRPRPANALPQSAQEYEQAGYPPELLLQQQTLESQREELSRRRRHGAQYAVNQYRQQEYERSVGTAGGENDPRQRASYPPSRDTFARRAPAREGEAARLDAASSFAPTAADGLAIDGAGASSRRASVPPQAGGPRPGVAANNAPAARYAAPSARYADAPSQASSPGYGEAPLSPAPARRGAAYSAAAAPERPAYVHSPRHQALETPARAWPGSAETDPGGPEPQSPYRVEDDEPWQDAESDEAPMYEERPPVPWLGIAVFVAAFLAVGLWLLQLTFTSQTEQVIRARKENNEAIRNRHPYSYEELIEKEAENNNLHPAFVAAIVLNESSFKPNATSDVGARGLMQVMDETASFVYEKLHGSTDGYDFDTLYDAETNVQIGCWYLSFLCERFRSDPVLVAAAYHAGPNQVQNWLNDSRYSADNLTIALDDMLDGPTKQYATRVVRDYAIYKGLYYQTTEGDA